MDEIIEKLKKKSDCLVIDDDFNYINSKTKTKFKCKFHGEYYMVPQNFSKKGCKLCNQNKRLLKQKEKVLNTIEETYRDKYDLSKMNKYSSRDKNVIICPKHGEFTTTISNFVYLKQGCKKCSDDKKRDNSYFEECIFARNTVRLVNVLGHTKEAMGVENAHMINMTNL